MNGQNQEPPEIKEMDIKAELKRAQINLHNSRIQVQIQEAIVKKFQELAR